LATFTIVASDDEANKALVKYFRKFLQSITAGSEELRNALTTEARAKARKRTISTLMNDLVTHNLREKLSDSPQIKFIDKYGQLKVVLPEGFLMKCKQSKRKRLSFINTQLMFEFMNQLPLMLPEMPSPLTNIILTYQFNRARTEIEKVSLLCPADERNYYWELPISGVPELLPAIEHQQAPELPAEPKRVVPKARRTKKSKKGLMGKNEQQGRENKS
jgi:hypothetical protein